MSLFTHPDFDGHEEVAYFHDPESGLKAIVAVHNLSRGPALGGCRTWPYESEDEALTDVLRLSRGMTYKSALAGLDYGGGKSVIIGDSRRDKTPALFRALGRFIETLGGRYIVAEDVGIDVEDVEAMARETDHVAGIPSRGAGDPSPATAYGVYMGIRAAVQHRLGHDEICGLKVAVQGLGHVGAELCRLLARDGAGLIVSDIHEASVARVVAELGAEAVEPDAIYEAEADVFAPCALGAIINTETIARLGSPIVAGSANNQLAEPDDGRELRRRAILYAPDYVINAGGIIYLSHEGPGFQHNRAVARVAGIHDTLLEIFRRADAERVPTSEAADRMAEERFRKTASPTHAAA